MDNLPVAMILSDRYSGARSALPDAPVVPDRPRPVRAPRAARSRAVLARVLERAARAVEPAPACSPAP